MDLDDLLCQAVKTFFFMSLMTATFSIVGRRTRLEMDEAENSSDRHFTVRIPHTFVRVMLILGLVPLGLAFILLVVGVSTRNAPLLPVAAVMVVCAIPALVLCVCWNLWKIQVDDGNIVCVSFVGVKRTVAYTQIEQAQSVSRSNHGGIALYAGGNRLCQITDEYECYKNLLGWLAKVGVKVEPDVHGITKQHLFWMAAREMTLFFIGFAVIADLIMILAAMYYGTLTLALVVEVTVLIFAFFVIFLAVMFASTTCVGLFRIGVQERTLGYDFEQEMAGKTLKRGIYQDARWFVAVSSVYVLAFRRDWVLGVEQATDHYRGIDGRARVLTVHLANGRCWKTRVMDHRVAEAFMGWARGVG